MHGHNGYNIPVAATRLIACPISYLTFTRNHTSTSGVLSQIPSPHLDSNYPLVNKFHQRRSSGYHLRTTERIRLHKSRKYIVAFVLLLIVILVGCYLDLHGTLPLDRSLWPFSDGKTGLERKISEVQALVTTYAAKQQKDRSAQLPQLSVHPTDIPIVLLACNRPALMQQTIESLLNVRGVKRENVLISQDGTLSEVADIAKKSGFMLIQNLNSELWQHSGMASNGAARIAQHYKYSLTAAFNIFKDAQAVIVLEDDLLSSPDLYEYLLSVAPILDADPTAFVVSGWSDNGFKDKVHEPYALRRTDYFPGLGWLLTRKLYKEELEPNWPTSHWDHWLRSEETSKHRDIIYPQVPRTYHNGIKGTFMNLETHNKYFRDIGYNTDPAVSWPPKELSVFTGATTSTRNVYTQGHRSVNQYRVEELVKRCKHVTSVVDLLMHKDEIICLWLDISTNCESHPVPFEPVAAFFGIWHEHRRGNHRGLHEFYWEGNYLLLLNVFDSAIHGGGYNSGSGGGSAAESTYRHLMPPTVKPIRQGKQFDKSLLADMKRRNLHIQPVKATRTGMSCNEVCQAEGKKCNEAHLQLVNTCAALQESFPCAKCRDWLGTDLPAYVNPQAHWFYGPGDCLVNAGADKSTCDGANIYTHRLCACD